MACDLIVVCIINALAEFVWIKFLTFWTPDAAFRWVKARARILIEKGTSSAIRFALSAWGFELFWLATEWTEAMIIDNIVLILRDTLTSFEGVQLLTFWTEQETLYKTLTSTRVLIEDLSFVAIFLASNSNRFRVTDHFGGSLFINACTE